MPKAPNPKAPAVLAGSSRDPAPKPKVKALPKSARPARRWQESHGGNSLSTGRYKPADGPDDADSERDDNAYFEHRGRRERRRTRPRGPTRYIFPRSELWLCAEDDLTVEFLRTFHSDTRVFTCKDYRVEFVEENVQQAGLRELPFPILQGTQACAD